MGPPLISGGNHHTFVMLIGASNASMGPPLISGGNSDFRSQRGTTPLSFNGAAADQRRKRYLILTRKSTDERFNGAAADQRRKPAANVISTPRAAELQWGRR